MVGNANRLHNTVELNLSCPVLGSRHCTYCTCAYKAVGDPARRPGIPQPWYWHGIVQQGSLRFNEAEDEWATCLFLSCCTYSMIYLLLCLIHCIFTLLALYIYLLVRKIHCILTFSALYITVYLPMGPHQRIFMYKELTAAAFVFT